MRKSILIIAATALIGAFVAAPSTAGARGCDSFSCVNKKLTKLKKKQARTARTVRVLQSFANCERIVRVSSYGDPNNSFGYDYSNNGIDLFFTTALDFTAPGDQVDEWVVVDVCAGKTGKRAAGARQEAPVDLVPQHR